MTNAFANRVNVRSRGAGAVCILAAAALVLSSCSGGGSVQAESLENMDPVTLTLADIGAESVNGVSVKAFADEVSEKSGGKITIEPYFSATLAAPGEALGAVSSGTADIGFILAGMFPQELPIASWGNGLTTDATAELPLAIFEGPAGHVDFTLNNEALTEEFRQHNARILWSSIVDTRHSLLCKDPVTTLDQAKGKRVHAGGAVHAAGLESIGMVSTNLPTTEWYEALQRGVVDCISIQPTGTKGFSLMDVAKNYTLAQTTGIAGSYMIMNEDSFDQLPLEGQRIILEAQATWIATRIGLGVEAYQWIGEMGKSGEANVLEPEDDLAAALANFQSGAHDKAIADAPESLENSAEWLTEYAATFDKWGEILVNDLGLPAETGDDPVAAMTDGAGDIDMEKLEQLLRENIFTPLADQLPSDG